MSDNNHETGQNKATADSVLFSLRLALELSLCKP
jgi:hypothetical protein